MMNVLTELAKRIQMEKLQEELDGLIGKFAITNLGVGKVTRVNLNGWFDIDVAGLGVRSFRIEDIGNTISKE